MLGGEPGNEAIGTCSFAIVLLHIPHLKIMLSSSNWTFGTVKDSIHFLLSSSLCVREEHSECVLQWQLIV